MATVNFLYRSTKERAPLTIRLQYWIDNEDEPGKKKGIFVDAKTELFLTRNEWDIYQECKNKTPKDVSKKNIKEKVNSVHRVLEERILSSFNAIAPERPSKEWLQEIVNIYHHPELAIRKERIIPKDLISFIDFYIEDKNLNKIMKAKFNVLKMRLVDFQDHRKNQITFNDLDISFAFEFGTYYKNVQQYKVNTLMRDFGYISSLCLHAKKYKVEMNPLWEDFKFSKIKNSELFQEKEDQIIFDNSKIYYPYFKPYEIDKITQFEDLTDEEDNVRDWLLISIITGQRISDFMEFTPNNISHEENGNFLKFIQRKTKAKLKIPIGEKLQRILDKRDGNFPKKLSHPFYNRFLKRVVRKIGFTEKLEGYKTINLENIGNRKVLGEYQRWETISSHVGRRTFVTNNFRKMPLISLRKISGHKTESQLLRYINETSEELANYIAKEHIDLF